MTSKVLNDLVESSILGTYCIRILGLWAVLHGSLTIIGGPQRWSIHLYDVVKMLPGSPYTWGVVLVVAGLLVLFASWKGPRLEINLFRVPIINRRLIISYTLIKNTGLLIIAGWSLLFAIGLFTAVLGHPELSFAAADRDLVMCSLAMMMTKAREPKVVENVHKKH